MDEAAIKAVMEKIKAAYWNRRLIDEDLIRAVGSPEMMALLVEQLGSEDAVIRTEAGFALAAIVGEGAKSLLISALSSERWEVRAGATEALAHFEDFQLTHQFIALLNDAALPVRIAATEALASLRGPSAVPSLIAAIQDPRRQVYAYATYALYDIAEHYEIPALFAYLSSDNIHLRIAAAYILGARGGKDAVRGLIDLARVGISGDRTEFEHALEHLRLIGEPAVDALIAVLDERDAALSQLAIGVLAQVKDARALPHMVAAMGDKDDQVYMVATWGVCQFGEAAIPLLLEALKNDHARLRVNAADALGNIGDARVTGDLVALLNDHNAEVRHTILFALAKIGAIDAVKYIIPLLKGAAQRRDHQWTTAGFAAQVLTQNLTTPEGLAAVEKWKREEAE